MEKIDIAIIGGGASGLFLANALEAKENVVIFERGERVGRKLSATGNGQGNITHLNADQTEYFSSEPSSLARAQKCIQAYNQNALMAFFQSRGVLLQADDRGRVYPAGRQASSLTDALRFALAERGVRVELSSKVTEIKRTKEGFLLTVEKANDGGRVAFTAKKVVLCGGGKAAKNFGTDGACYELAKSLGHTCTALYPSLVQLKTDTTYTKTLKGIRVNDGGLTARFGNGKTISLQGDIIFTDYGVSGDAVFRISAFITDHIEGGKVELSIDFLPNVVEDELLTLLEQKRRAFPAMVEGELLLGILNNQVGRAVMKRAGNDLRRAAKLVKAFPLTVTGSLGFDYAQVTKGGIPMSEVDDHLQSKIVPNLYFAGEILDIDGPCGGFNLQWAFSSAQCVAKALRK